MRAELTVDDVLEDVLLRSARALRRMGSRLTRYDAGALTLEARLTWWRVPLVVRISASAVSDRATRLAVEAEHEGGPGRFDFGLARLAIARFRATLARTDLPAREA